MMEIKRSAAALALSLTCFLCPHTTKAATFFTVDSGNNSEKLTQLPGDDAWHVLYSVPVGSLAVGDILVVHGEGELSNEESDPNALPRLSAQLLLTTSATATTGSELDEGNGFLISHDMNHGVPVKHAIRMVCSNLSPRFVNFVVAANGPLVVDQDYGRLQVMVIHRGLPCGQ